jgi:hypothetical protein
MPERRPHWPVRVPQANAASRQQSPPNPQALPTASQWKIWSRLIAGTKTDTVPTHPIPVRALTVAALDALDPKAPAT